MMTKKKDCAEKAIRDIRRATRRQYSAEEKIRIVLEGLQGSFKIAPGDFVNFLRRFNSSSQSTNKKTAMKAVFLSDGRGERIYSSHPWDSPFGLALLCKARSKSLPAIL